MDNVSQLGDSAPATSPAMASVQMNCALLEIIRANFNMQYVMQAPGLSAFHGAVAMHSGTNADATSLVDFQTCAPY